jgi:hypothetical protein
MKVGGIILPRLLWAICRRSIWSCFLFATTRIFNNYTNLTFYIRKVIKRKELRFTMIITWLWLALFLILVAGIYHQNCYRFLILKVPVCNALLSILNRHTQMQLQSNIFILEVPVNILFWTPGPDWTCVFSAPSSARKNYSVAVVSLWSRFELWNSQAPSRCEDHLTIPYFSFYVKFF